MSRSESEGRYEASECIHLMYLRHSVWPRTNHGYGVLLWAVANVSTQVRHDTPQSSRDFYPVIYLEEIKPPRLLHNWLAPFRIVDIIRECSRSQILHIQPVHLQRYNGDVMIQAREHEDLCTSQCSSRLWPGP